MGSRRNILIFRYFDTPICARVHGASAVSLSFKGLERFERLEPAQSAYSPRPTGPFREVKGE